MITINDIIENHPDDEFVKVDGFDDAIIGFENNDMRLIYSVEKCLEILVDSGMDEIDAIEHFTYNVCGGCAFENPPIFCWDVIL